LSITGQILTIKSDIRRIQIVFAEVDMDTLKIADREFTSRLFIGTGKFSSAEDMLKAIEASGTTLVTVALRRLDFNSPDDEYIENIDAQKVLLVPNTSGARTASEALHIAKLARSAGAEDWVKLELTPEPRYLLPDPVETLRAAELLVKDGFKVLPYINADPVLSKKLEDAGCPAVMPLGSPIGSNRGIKSRDMIEIIIEQSGVPVIVDAGIGRPSHAAEAMELGADAVLVNTAVATSPDPAKSAYAFKLAVEAGRIAYLHGSTATSKQARASSPLKGFVENLK
jgi:thiazole synthase